MRKLLLVLVAIPSFLMGQQDVPEKYWLDDSNYEKVINEKGAFDDSEEEIIVVEYWAKFNEANCFEDWKKLQNVSYYRVDISKAPLAKKKYRVRMAPTLFVVKGGVIEYKYKAGLDLLIPVTLKEIQSDIDELKKSSQF
mgnify:CR=1 FL=1|jgi:hypothetical protein|tara:strand:+ start:64 stop:480 length:417 start_codon:yes stop_codon:yes gene_type:complete